MEQKTKVHAEDGMQEITITRTFNLPAALVFRAYTEPEIVAQWMGTNVVKLDSADHGSYRFETSDAQGNVVFSAHGTLHKITPGKSIVRTFEMENAGFEPQLEFLDFEPLTESTSQLTIKIIYKSVALRDAQLKLPFAFGLNMAHNRLEEVAAGLL